MYQGGGDPGGGYSDKDLNMLQPQMGMFNYGQYWNPFQQQMPMGGQPPPSPQHSTASYEEATQHLMKQREAYEHAQSLEAKGHATGLHVDRIPIDTLTKDVASTISSHLGVEVIHIEDKRGQKTVHCCAFAIVAGKVDFSSKKEHLAALPVQEGVLQPPGNDLNARKIRIQLATRRPENVQCQEPRCTLHIRVMTQRRNWAFGVSGLSWQGLACMLDLASPGAAKNVILVADDTSEKTSQAHPENFICGFFVECSSVAAAHKVLSQCGDQRVVLDQVPFRIAAEYTRKQALRLYDKPPKLRQDKQLEFDKVRAQAEEVAMKIRNNVPMVVSFSGRGVPGCGELNDLFKFMNQQNISRLPKWYQERLRELGWTPPGHVRANDNILEPFLKSIGMDMYYPMLSAEGVCSYLDLEILDDDFLKEKGMDKVVHRRKLLQHISELRPKVTYDEALSQIIMENPPTTAQYTTTPLHLRGQQALMQLNPAVHQHLPMHFAADAALGNNGTTPQQAAHMSTTTPTSIPSSNSPPAEPAEADVNPAKMHRPGAGRRGHIYAARTSPPDSSLTLEKPDHRKTLGHLHQRMGNQQLRSTLPAPPVSTTTDQDSPQGWDQTAEHVLASPSPTNQHQSSGGAPVSPMSVGPAVLDHSSWQSPFPSTHFMAAPQQGLIPPSSQALDWKIERQEG